VDRKMKVLISYDGSDYADAVLRDLGRAGLPPEAEAIVISTTDSSFPAPAQYRKNGLTNPGGIYPSAALDKATALARQATDMLREDFPDWEIHINLAVGSTVGVLAKKAGGWIPDLIVIGSQKYSAASGSIFRAFSRQVDTTINCSIRVARKSFAQAKAEDEFEIGARILVCVQESPRAEAIISAVASRFWPKSTEVRLLTVVDPYDYSIVDLLDQKISRIKLLHRQLANELYYTPVYTSSVVKEGESVRVILKEVEDWKPHCVFMGMCQSSLFGRLLGGDISTALIANAHCPVELVRTAQPMSAFTRLIRLPAALLGM